MFTVCPKCTLTLAVTANDLRVGQGYVRCGRCSNVFNALLKLSEALDDADAEGGPPIAQADPASSSQISRAISSEATSSATTPPPAPRSAAAGVTPPAAATGSATRGSAGAAAAAGGTAGRGPAPTAPPTPVSAPAPTPTSAPIPAPRAMQPPPAAQAAQVRAAGPAPSSAQAPRAAAASHSAQPAYVPPAPQTAQPQAGRAALPPASARATAASAATPAVDSRSRQAAQTPTPPSPAPSRSASATPAPAVSAKPGPSPFAAAPPGGSHTPTDEEAIDQFELVLKTLGLSLEEDEPPLRQQTPAAPEPNEPDTPDTSTRVVENIVLEGEGVSQSQAEMPDRPLDELDQFTRRLSRVSGKAGQPPAKRNPPERAPGKRAAGPPPARGGTAEARPPQAHISREARESDEFEEISFEEEAALDELSLNDPMLDEPLPAESIEPMDAEARPGADLDIPALDPNPYRWAWLAGCLLLALLLVLQIISHWRERLALSPTWGGAVRAVYAAVGAPIAPRWDLTAYEVRQQGAESEPGRRAQIRVRFSLANHATHAQPVPLLRLTLLDRYGRRVAQRDLTPADYWPQGRAPATFLAADERIDTEVQVRDPSADSASFELDVCLRDARGLLHCAGDANAGGTAAGAGVDGAP